MEMAEKTEVNRLRRLCGLYCGWWSGVVVSTLASINEVNLRRARLVLRWATVSGFIFPVPDIYFGM